MRKLISYVLCLALIVSCLSGLLTVGAAGGTPTLAFLTEAVYDEMGSLSDGLIWARQGDKYMYLDANGEVVISNDQLIKVVDEDRVWYITDFHDGIALVDGYYINTKGEQVLADLDEWVNDFSDGVAIMYNYGIVSYVDKTGKTFSGTPVSEEDYAYLVTNDNQWVEIDYGRCFSEGLLTVHVWFYEWTEGDEGEYVDSRCVAAGFVDKNLKIATGMDFEFVYPFNNGLAAAERDGKWGFIDKTGAFVIQPQFDNFVYFGSNPCEVFNDGLAIVEKDGKWGYVDTKGNTVIPFAYDWDTENGYWLNRFRDGKTYIKQGGKYGYIDKTGKALTGYIYDDANFFCNGVALVATDGVYRLIDEAGNAVSTETWSFSWSTVGYGYDDLVIYNLDGKYGMAKITAEAADTPSSWAVEEVERAVALGLVPEAFQSRYTSNMTRAEFCALGVRLYETVTGGEITELAEFDDTDDMNVRKLAGVGVINGVGNGMFDPDSALNREQAATIIDRLMTALGSPMTESEPTFADNGSISDWAIDAVGKVQANGIMNGVGDNKFSPAGSYTREQCIMTILRTYTVYQLRTAAGE